jgi:hypothetical protein
MLSIAANLVTFTCQANKFTGIPRALRKLILPLVPCNASFRLGHDEDVGGPYCQR